MARACGENGRQSPCETQEDDTITSFALHTHMQEYLEEYYRQAGGQVNHMHEFFRMQCRRNFMFNIIIITDHL